MFAVCSVSFPVARDRSALGSRYRRKPFAKEPVWDVSRVHSLTHGWVGGEGETTFNCSPLSLLTLGWGGGGGMPEADFTHNTG